MVLGVPILKHFRVHLVKLNYTMSENIMLSTSEKELFHFIPPCQKSQTLAQNISLSMIYTDEGGIK